MKIIHFFILLLFISCKSVDANNLYGTWKLTGVSISAGDEPGKLQKVNSNRKITFSADNIFSSNGNICQMDISDDKVVVGKFSECKKFEGYLEIDSPKCKRQPIFKIQNQKLILQYLCVEGCSQEFEKISNK